MSNMKFLFAVLLILSYCALNEARSYNNGLIFYNLENHQIYLPPTISVSRGRGLAKFKYSPRGSIWSTFGRPCDCEGPLCGCCVGIKVKQYNFDQKMCANVSYVPLKEEIQLEVFLNDTANAKYGISARDPSPLCIPIMMGIPMSMCIKMSNVGLQGDNLNMCMDFLVRLASTEIFEMHFQCMQVGLQGANWVGPDGNPVIPPSEGKIKDKSNNESDEYYEDTDDDAEEDEEENEVITKEEQKKKDNELMNMMEKHEENEEDLNKAEEEMDYNDIADKVMDIVKEQEQDEEGIEESDELVKKNEAEGVKPVAASDMQMIVTNIMESIKESNDMNENEMITETAIELATNKSEMEKVESIPDAMNETPEMPMPIKLESSESSEKLEEVESMENSDMISETSQKPVELEAPESSEKGEELETLEKSETVTKETVLKAPEVEENEVIKEYLKESEESVNEVKYKETSDVNKVTEDLEEINEVIEDHTELESNVENSVKEELHLEESIQEGNVESPQKPNDPEPETEHLNEIKETPVPLEMQTVSYDSTTEHITTEMDSNKIEKFEMLINHDAVETTEIDKIDNELNNSLEIFQQPMETSTEHLMTTNLKPTMPQIATTTTQTDNDNSVDNSLTTATIMTTTTTTTKSSAMTSTTTKKPIASEENSIVAVTFIENTNDPDKTKNDNDNQGKDDNEEKEIENDNENSDKSHETDSDYEDEGDEEEEDDEEDDEVESDEVEDETTEHEEINNDATTNIMPTTASNLNKETPITEQHEQNAADDIEPQNNRNKLNENETENTTNKLEANKEEEEDEQEEDDEDFTDNADDEEETETKEKPDADDSEEEEYDEEYEDYETTTLAVEDLKPIKANDTCCKSTTPSAANDLPVTMPEEISTPETNPIANSNLQFVSNTNSVISSNDNDMLNIESTTNKMSQIITTKPAVTSTSTMHSTTNSNSNVMPLPMARQLFALHRQLQQQQQQEQYQYQQLQYPTYYRQSRHRQHYV